MKEESKQKVKDLVVELKELLAKRDDLRTLKKRVKGLKRLEHRIVSGENRYDEALAAEAQAEAEENTSEGKNGAAAAAKAKVDALEKSLASLKEAWLHRSENIVAVTAQLGVTRGIVEELEKKCFDEFHRLVRMGLISKRNCSDVLPLVRQCGLVIGSIKKRRWARK